MSQPQLLIENAPFTLRLEESKDGSGAAKYVVRGQFARSDKATENKRLYRENLWKREIGRLDEAMKARRAFGELDHPADGRTKLQRVSHLMTSLRVEGNEVVGEAQILDTPNGRILKSLFQAGAQVGVSSRGYGSTKAIRLGGDEVEEVQEDFRLDTFDFVADPATKTAYPKVFQEELEHISQANDSLTVESLRRDYPGLLREIAESSMGDIGRRLDEAEKRTEDRLKGTFQRELRGIVERLAEDAHQKARSEMLSDPEVAQAKTVLENIVSLVMPFGMDQKVRAEVEQKDAEIAQLRTKLADRELEVQKHVSEKAETEKLARRAGYQLHLERKIEGHPSKETILKLIGDVTSYQSIKEMEEKIDALLAEFKHVKPASAVASERHDELVKQVEGLRGEKADLEKKVLAAEEKRDEVLGKARKAVEIAEGLQVQLHLEKKIGSRPDAQRVRMLSEGVALTSEKDVDDFLARLAITPSEDIGDEQVRRIRERAARGKASDLTEDRSPVGSKGNGSQGSGLLEQLGLSDTEFDRLAGNGTRPQ